jgi:hypothetical protein
MVLRSVLKNGTEAAKSSGNGVRYFLLFGIIPAVVAECFVWQKGKADLKRVVFGTR